MKGSAVALVIGLALPAGAGAQDLDGARMVAPVALAPAVYAADGRDPFLPLIGVSEDEGRPPRLDQLILTGIFQGAPDHSLVVLEDPARRGHFLRVGETLGLARLLAILPDAAVFEVDEYGIVRQDTLRLEPERAAPDPPVGAPTTVDEPEPAPGTDDEGS